MEKGKVMAMYDIRGIQDYIFRTSKLKHIIGGSAIVETIIEDALKDAVSDYKDEAISSELRWEQELYSGEDKDVQVLYIGGGNAYVIYRDEELYLSITKKMSKYVLEQTYSLQLASACIPKTDDYQTDYRNLNKKMTKVKADMPDSRPVGAFPVMRVELATGLPAIDDNISFETQRKNEAERKKREKIKNRSKKFDSFIEEKGENSILAVIHIDGNNMGMRIRALLENEKTYVDAVNRMRDISYRINHSYKEVFADMQEQFNKNDSYFILPVLTAGDDITYVCTGKAALASVEYFVNGIKNKSMADNNGKNDEYGFSVCGGIAFIRSHFPFSIGYEVAEACCESAKDRAKSNLGENNKVGNFFDFQFCHNVQTTDIETIRKDEYITPTNDELLSRPFEIGGNPDKFYSYDKLKKYLEFFNGLKDENQKGTEKKSMPRSHAKTLRNTYPLGNMQVNGLMSFLESRAWKLPDGDYEPYVEINNEKIAKYYDALELMDIYIGLDSIVSEKTEAADEKVQINN